ncbi:zinc ABC transporter substrate-binding protein [Bacillus sp. DTU_2020_1000418_1_SI_GHA_SEK_038]|uniref:metal ABC transporter solute-binding protein, Zn/Mn family n=1 Tax=Bacillus sp. DTU_2020_1000418_1_SI_GHA_SEK_038 TaxID=3077585 RepID=UPI0028EAB677|nr:zinc ABC transporter substrate-binding protein [Bacillus sp. DTU_2020_1000418_1_SI_GHA_SEK_038]WNS74686.1 zinc ABC transporter substrate-binding protein [Bacillus sp. DTU_2020_1000418_1_SI_GHA_SEK_038]
MKKIFLFFLTLSLLLSGCAAGEEKVKEKESDTLTVYTTVYPLQYFSKRIGGNYVETKTVYPPGSDEHTFEPTQKDMMKLADADLFIFIGLGLEGFVEKAKEILKGEDVQMVAAGEIVHLDPTIKTDNDHEDHHDEEGNHEEHHHEDDGHNHGDIDPHVWIDPVYAKDLAEATKNALIEKMPEHKEEFNDNYDELIKELDQLDNDFKRIVDQAKHKEIIVSHSAFGYWEKRYGIEQISVSGLNSSNEPSQKQLEKIITKAKEHDLKYVFFEQNVSSKLTEIIQKELGAEPLYLHNLSVLTDKDINDNSTYFSIMNENLKALEKALN